MVDWELSRTTITCTSLCMRFQRAPARISTSISNTSRRITMAAHFRTGPRPASERIPSQMIGTASAAKISAAFQYGMNSRSMMNPKGRSVVGISIPLYSPGHCLEPEHLQTIVPGVHCDNPSVAIHRRGPGIGKLPWFAAGKAPGGEAPATLFVDQLHPIVSKFRDDQVAMGIFIQTIGKAELTEGGADRADVAEEGAVDVEDTDAVIA